MKVNNKACSRAQNWLLSALLHSSQTNATVISAIILEFEWQAQKHLSKNMQYPSIEKINLI